MILIHMKILLSHNVKFAEDMHIFNITIPKVKDVMIAAC
jgi:hypothetical protein